jgi:hypothetical protein
LGHEALPISLSHPCVPRCQLIISRIQALGSALAGLTFPLERVYVVVAFVELFSRGAALRDALVDIAPFGSDSEQPWSG